MTHSHNDLNLTKCVIRKFLVLVNMTNPLVQIKRSQRELMGYIEWKKEA